MNFLQLIIKCVLKKPLFFDKLRYIINLENTIDKRLIADKLLSRNDTRVLDVCCGIGHYSFLTDKYFYLGFDLNESYVRYAKNKYNNNFLVMDILKMGFRNKIFDNALLVSVLHHFSDEQTLDILKQLKYFIKNKIIIIDPDYEKSNIFQKFMLKLDRGGVL